MKLDLSKIVFGSDYAGLAQTTTGIFSVSVPSASWSPGAGATFTASYLMPNDAQIPDVQIQYTGLSTRWFQGPFAYFNYPAGTTIADSDMYVSSTMYFVGDTLFVRTFALNNSFDTLTRPAFTINVRAYLDEAPF